MSYDLRDIRDETTDKYDYPQVDDSIDSREALLQKYASLKAAAARDKSVLLQAGIDMLAIGETATAIEAFNLLVSENPDTAGYYWLGEAYSAAGRRDEALGAYTTSLELGFSTETIAAILLLQPNFTLPQLFPRA